MRTENRRIRPDRRRNRSRKNRRQVNGMQHIRPATAEDLPRIAEIIVFNYRLNFYPIFQDDAFYFREMQVDRFSRALEECAGELRVYDDGVVKGVVQISGQEIRRLFVEPVLQGQGIGAVLLEYAVREEKARELWALEKNLRAISFYERHGFRRTEDRRLEEDTTEYLVRLEKA